MSAGPQPPSNYPGAQPQYGVEYQQNLYQQQAHQYHTPGVEAYGQPAAPHIRNPFAPPSQAGASGSKDRFGIGEFDPEMEAQIAQWQSAYSSKDESSKSAGAGGYGAAGNANTLPLGVRGAASAPLSSHEVAAAVTNDSAVASVIAGADGKQKTVVRSGGGKTWQDPSLLEWDPAHFRLFVGNLAGEVTDESLLKAFSKYESVQKARVVRDKRTTKSRGFGFVSFSNGDEYFRAAREMEGKYIGSHPVQLKKSTTEIKATIPKDKKNQKGGKGGAGGGGKANTGAGVQKKPTKTKGGLRILG